ncbi:hypothetical protein H7I41_28445 [Mycobacterium manitobense]|uniref:Uncharacterized protein n=1 Tax=[Mycobacterium] manitobense TaxID=190147 RepID=A0A9X2YU94_9MYCO|nr:hypothetical protein [[Mycobacterium] manitobense]MCV7173859.1 hypothetical protein [[Mycobacterium] manitobense]
MTITRGLPAALIIAAGVAVGSAGTGWAGGPTQVVPVPPNPTAAGGEPFQGVYDLRYTRASGQVLTGTWTVAPCGPGCANVTAAVEILVPYSGNARLTGNQWAMTINRPDAVICPDERRLPGTTTYTWDSATLAGGTSTSAPVNCEGVPQGPNRPGTFTLTRRG